MPWFSKRAGGAGLIKARRSGGGTEVVRRASYPYNPQWTPDRVMREAMDRVTWVWRCVDAIAGNQANLPLIWRKDDAVSGQPVKNHPLNSVLNSASNMGENSFVFRYRLSSQLLLSSRGVFVEIVRNRMGEVIAMTLLPPQYVTPVPNPQTFVSSYSLDIPGEPHVSLRPDQVIWLRKPHPFDPYRAITPLEAAGVAIESDWLYKLYNRNFLLNDGRPGGLIIVKGVINDDDKEELRARYRGNINTVGRIGVIASQEGADFVDTAITPRDAAYIDGKKATKEEILMAFGVSESVLSNASGRTFDNAEQERLIFWMETMNGNHLPLIERPLDVLDLDPTVFCNFDTSGVDVIQRAEIKRRDFLVKEFSQGLITQNMYLEETGRKKLAEGGDTLWIPGNYIPIGSTKKGALEEAKNAIPKKDTPLPGQRPAGRPQDEPMNQDGPDPEPSRGSGDRKPRLVAASAAGALPAAEPHLYPEQVIPVRLLMVGAESEPAPAPVMVKLGPWRVPEEALDAFKAKTLDDYLRWETVYERAFQRLFERQHRVVTEKVMGQKMRTWLAKREGWKGTPVFEQVFDQETWDDQTEQDFDPLIAGTMQEFASDITSALKVTAFDVNSDAGLAARKKQILRLLLVNVTTKKRVEDELADGAEAGETQEQLVDRVATVFQDAHDVRARAAAITEVVAAIAAGKILGAAMVGSPPAGVDQGDIPQKTWVTVGDNRVRDTHDEVDGTTIALHEYFDVGGSAMQFPGDPDGDPEEVVNCRCGLVIDGAEGPIFA